MAPTRTAPSATTAGDRSAKTAQTILLLVALALLVFNGGCSGVSGAINSLEEMGATSYSNRNDNGDALTELDELDYEDEDLWICGSGAADVCLSADLNATEVRADGTFENIDIEPLSAPDVDCFYVHPNVDFKREPGNVSLSSVHYARSHVAPVATRQAAIFRGACRVFAPLYRHITRASYAAALDADVGYEWTTEFGRAYADIVAAFDHYMTEENAGRPIVFIGHGHGTHLLTRLLRERFDEDSAMRSKLVSALLLGPLGGVLVPDNRVVGGTFKHIPLCEDAQQRGCIVTFDSEAAGLETKHADALLFPDGMTRACTNPASLAGGVASMDATLWSKSDGQLLPDEVEHAWALYPDLYVAGCGARGALQIDVRSDDPRSQLFNPQEIQQLWELLDQGHGLHEFDLTYAAGDLLRIVKAQASRR